MHVGADLDIFTRDASWVPQPEAVPEKSVVDPFADLPLRALAERLGEHFQPVAKAIQEEHERGRGDARKQFAAQAVGPDELRIPSVLPITKWYECPFPCKHASILSTPHRTAENPAIRNTLIADDPKTRKRARLSWYHPEDTVRCFLVFDATNHLVSHANARRWFRGTGLARDCWPIWSITTPLAWAHADVLFDTQITFNTDTPQFWYTPFLTIDHPERENDVAADDDALDDTFEWPLFCR